jgi:hypothetical protein
LNILSRNWGFASAPCSTDEHCEYYVNQGHDKLARDHQDRILSTMKLFADLSPTMYMQTIAKLIIEKKL